jgi:hypothetical protein
MINVCCLALPINLTTHGGGRKKSRGRGEKEKRQFSMGRRQQKSRMKT